MITKLSPKKQELLNGRWQLFENATNDIDGRFPDSFDKYIIGADCASGLPGRNGTAACVLSINRHEQVAVLAGQITPEETAHQLELAGWFFNCAEIAIERQTHGAFVINSLYQKYPNLYYHQQSTTGWQQKTTIEYGWTPGKNGYSGVSNRQIAIDLLARDVGYILSEFGEEKKKAIKINDKNTVAEMRTFVRLQTKNRTTGKETAKEQAAMGKFDDRVSALYIANFVWNERFKVAAKEQVQQETTIWERMQMYKKQNPTHHSDDENRSFGPEVSGFYD